MELVTSRLLSKKWFPWVTFYSKSIYFHDCRCEIVGIFFKKMLLEWSDTIQALVLNISLGKMEL
jgi:hypothetical protein